MAMNDTTSISDSRGLIVSLFAWILSVAAVATGITVWAHDHGFHLSGHQSIYVIFPVLGLSAYSIMWSQYVTGVFRRLLGQPPAVLRTYFKSTRFVVLALICLHPGLLIYQRFRDGYGLPPVSYERYVAPGLGWVTLLGTACLLIFLAYELHGVFGKKPWWKYVAYAGDAAMLGIFYHGLRLGSDLQFGWFMKLWWFYGITLVGSLAYTYTLRFKAHK